jgi:DsbC/DsbD-like thiol-disulfide interchange protein
MRYLQCLYFLVFSLFLFSASSYAQGITDPTTWTYEVKKTGTGEYDLIFHVALTDGWHIFSQKPGDDFLIPPSFIFKSPNAKLVGKVKEKGTLKREKMEGIDNPINYYEKSADFVQKVKARAGAKITGEHEYQVCNEMMCLPPKKKPFEFVLN